MRPMAARPKPNRSTTGNRRGGQADTEFFRRRSLPAAPADDTATQLAATVDAVVFSNADGTFTILRATDDRDEKVVLKGALAPIHVGEHLNCTGRWQQHAIAQADRDDQTEKQVWPGQAQQLQQHQ